MTGDRDTTDRATKRMRRVARPLAVIWAGVWTFNVAATTWMIESGPVWTRRFSVGSWLTIAGLVLIPWVSAAVAWRWGIGGVVLALVGFLTSTRGWGMLFTAVHFRLYGDMVTQMVFLPCLGLSYVTPLVALLAGALFLASWWKSSTSPIRLRLIGIGLGGLGGLIFLVLSASVTDRLTEADVQWRATAEVEESSAYRATATAEAYATATALVARSRNIELVGQMPGHARGVFVQGGYAYVAGGRRGLRVVDISDPTAPVEVGSYAREFAHGVFVSGSYAYVAAGPGGLRVVDISRPTVPVEVGSEATPHYPYHVFVSDSYAYMVVGGLQVVDVSKPAGPYQVSFYPAPGLGWGYQVHVSDSYAYVAGGQSGLRVVDVSNPTAPVEVGSYIASGRGAVNVFVAGSYAYVADSHGLQVVNVSDPASPYEVGFYESGPGLDQGVYVSGSYAYMAGSLGLQVVDVSNPATPVEVGFYATPGEGLDLYVSGPYAYLAAGDGGLIILRMVKD